jgi:TPP-dependent pyruvate/acetoin dehydrogenase alpha subunit
MQISEIIDIARLKTFHKEMLYIRLVEEAIANRYKENEMRCPVHLSIGQEATAVGVCQALKVTDKVFSTHRCHAHYLAKGGDLKRMLAEIYGKVTGCCGGRGGSMHLTDPDKGMVVSIPIVASNIPLAVGSALSSRIDGKNTVSIAFVGDGSLEEGVFHESANFAQINKLPVLFVCENNMYSVYTHLNARQPQRALTDLGIAHKMFTLSADGNDVKAVFAAATEAVAFARSGKGPVFLVFETYRWREHCGPNYDNHIGYRTEEEFMEWKKKDPLKLITRELMGSNLLSAQNITDLEKELNTIIEEAFEFAKSSPLPDPSQVSQFIYKENAII